MGPAQQFWPWGRQDRISAVVGQTGGGEGELTLLPCITAVTVVSSLNPASLSPNEGSGRESARQHFPEGAAPALPRKWS